MDFSKYNCGTIISSNCVPFTGVDLTILLGLSEADQLPCNANINDVINKLDVAIKKLIDSNDLTELDANCLDFDPATITPKELHQIEINKICEHNSLIATLQDTINNLEIGDESITIILPDCLQASIADCEEAENTYQLKVLLLLLANKLCNHETRITNLEA